MSNLLIGVIASVLAVFLVECLRRLFWFKSHNYLDGIWRHTEIPAKDDEPYRFLDNQSTRYNAVEIRLNILNMNVQMRTMADEQLDKPIKGQIVKRNWIGEGSMASPYNGTSSYRYVPDKHKPHWGNHELWGTKKAISVRVVDDGTERVQLCSIIHVATRDSGSRLVDGRPATSTCLWLKVTDPAERAQYMIELQRREW